MYVYTYVCVYFLDVTCFSHAVGAYSNAHVYMCAYTHKICPIVALASAFDAYSNVHTCTCIHVCIYTQIWPFVALASAGYHRSQRQGFGVYSNTRTNMEMYVCVYIHTNMSLCCTDEGTKVCLYTHKYAPLLH